MVERTTQAQASMQGPFQTALGAVAEHQLELHKDGLQNVGGSMILRENLKATLMEFLEFCRIALWRSADNTYIYIYIHMNL